jgi:hypothetical protein
VDDIHLFLQQQLLQAGERARHTPRFSERPCPVSIDVDHRLEAGSIPCGAHCTGVRRGNRPGSDNRGPISALDHEILCSFTSYSGCCGRDDTALALPWVCLRPNVEGAVIPKLENVFQSAGIFKKPLRDRTSSQSSPRQPRGRLLLS